MNQIIPTEQKEAELFVEMLQKLKIEHWHIIQENIVSHPAYWNKLKKQGWNKGLSDYLVFIPVEKSKYEKSLLLWVELKRQKRRLKNGKLGSSPSKVYPEQIEFLEKMNTVGSVQGEIHYGADSAIEFVKRFLK